MHAVEPVEIQAATPLVPARSPWVDVAKGMAIVLVVLYHAAYFPGAIGLGWRWSLVSGSLTAFRMPLFFFTAGLFAWKILEGPLGALLRRRVAWLVWVYVVWSLIWVVVFKIVPWFQGPQNGPTWREFSMILVWPNGSTWFTYALAVFFVAAWAMRRWPIWVQLATAAALSCLFGSRLVESGNDAIEKMGAYFIFFLIAARFGRSLRQLAGSARWGHVLALAGVFLATLVVGRTVGGPQVPGLLLVQGLVAVPLGVSTAVVLSKLRPFAWLSYLGRRTLPIYLLHFYPILIFTTIVAPDTAAWQQVAPVLPLALTAAAVVLALAVHRITQKVPGLYELPPSVAARLQRHQ